MNKKMLIISIIILILFGIGYWIYTNISFVDDELLSNSNLNATVSASNMESDITGNISVYLIDKQTLSLSKEIRSVSLKSLNEDPYLTILQELQKSTNNLLSPIPFDTQILSCNIQNSTLIIDLTEKFVTQDVSNSLDTLILQSIVKTLSNLKEISNIQILINGDTSKKLGNYSLSKSFNISSFD